MPDVDFKLNWLLSSVCGCCSFSSLWHANGCCGMLLIEGMLGFSFLASDGHCKALWASGSVCAVQKWWIIMFAYSSCMIIWHTIDISVDLCAVNYRASRMLLTTTKVVAAATSSATWVSIFSADFFFFFTCSKFWRWYITVTCIELDKFFKVWCPKKPSR